MARHIARRAGRSGSAAIRAAHSASGSAAIVAVPLGVLPLDPGELGPDGPYQPPPVRHPLPDREAPHLVDHRLIFGVDLDAQPLQAVDPDGLLAWCHKRTVAHESSLPLNYT